MANSQPALSGIVSFDACMLFGFWCPRSKGISSPSGTKFGNKKLETPRYRTVKTRSLCITWAWFCSGTRQTKGQTLQAIASLATTTQATFACHDDIICAISAMQARMQSLSETRIYALMTAGVICLNLMQRTGFIDAPYGLYFSSII